MKWYKLFHEIYRYYLCNVVNHFLFDRSENHVKKYACDCFSGLQRQPNVKTVAGVIEKALANLKSSNANKLHLKLSSRTDRGVHALCNTAHVDILHRNVDSEFDANEITRCVNKFMQKHKEPVRIIKTLRVNQNFHSRFHAVHRTYLYRLCVAEGDQYFAPFPPQEQDRCFFVRDNIDWQKVKEGIHLLNGTHNFSCFSTERSLKDQPWVNPVKTLEVSVARSKSVLDGHLPWLPCSMQFWDFTYKSGSFLYRQVRRMTALLLATGMGKINLDTIRILLGNPTDHVDHVDIVRQTQHYDVPGCGLYLKEVGYREEELDPNCEPPTKRDERNKS